MSNKYVDQVVEDLIKAGVSPEKAKGQESKIQQHFVAGLSRSEIVAIMKDHLKE